MIKNTNKRNNNQKTNHQIANKQTNVFFKIE